jgi:hypothetical protein
VEVVPDLGERVLRRLALEIAQFVNATALDRRPRPHQPDGAPQPGVTVDDRQHRRPQPARNEIVEAPLPRRERLACEQFQGEEPFAPSTRTPTTPNAGTLTTFPPLRTRRAKPSR